MSFIEPTSPIRILVRQSKRRLGLIPYKAIKLWMESKRVCNYLMDMWFVTIYTRSPSLTFQYGVSWLYGIHKGFTLVLENQRDTEAWIVNVIFVNWIVGEQHHGDKAHNKWDTEALVSICRNRISFNGSYGFYNAVCNEESKPKVAS